MADHTMEPARDDLKPYKIHISSKYLDLTRKKLEVTRLPREGPGSTSTLWWEPKAIVEPLIDFWLEEYSWREQQDRLNEQIPQFRLSLQIPSSTNPIRVHLIHSRSPYNNAIPLLLIPPFPFCNLSIAHLTEPLTTPDDPDVDQPFHVVIPSLPGLGFSDALPTDANAISVTCQIFDMLMRRLGYEYYIGSNSSVAASSPAHVDWEIARHLSKHYADSCLGFNMICPPLRSPKFSVSPLSWAAWKLSWLTQTPLFGFTQDDLKLSKKTAKDTSKAGHGVHEFALGESSLNLVDPTALSYALCDSPTGLLLFILLLLKTLGSNKDFTNSEIITFAELAWLPGPEAMLRFWATCTIHKQSEAELKPARSRVGITVFTGTDATLAAANNSGRRELPTTASYTYSCPMWAKDEFQVVSTSRIKGKPGLVPLEHPAAIERGIRDLAKAVMLLDKRLKAAEPVQIPLLEQVVVTGGEPAIAEVSGTTIQGVGESSSGLTSPRSGQEGGIPVKEDKKKSSSLTTFGVDPSGHLQPVSL